MRPASRATSLPAVLGFAGPRIMKGTLHTRSPPVGDALAGRPSLSP
ncbi:hypothetical protein OG806_16655 [Streptomyces sp. NBC_00882]|nr:hypothetical protein OG806_16655 [Streptomyces sp. NBC_00882]WSZ57819.1 hypothetical protein OH824_15185 [Streptomyces canus]